MKQIPVKLVYEFMKTMVNHPFPTICVHNACCTLISIMDKHGYVLSEDEVRLVGTLCDASQGDCESNQILDKLLDPKNEQAKPKYEPVEYK